MLKSCVYCGRIHERKYMCAERLATEESRMNRNRRDSEQVAIRNSNAWKKKTRHIKIRDKYMCQACIHGIGYMPEKRITTDNLQVHHITSLAEDKDKAFDNENLITLCNQCHKLAEAGKIKKGKLVEIARNNENTPRG